MLLSEAIESSTKSRVLVKEPLAKYTTFKVGGPADIFVVPSSVTDLQKTIELANEERFPVFIMGNGSNLLISDDGIRGVVIRLAGNLDDLELNDTTVKAGAGNYLKKLIYTSAEKGLSGLEFFVGIPSSLGGSIAMNMGSWGTSISSVIKKVTILTNDTNELYTLNNSQCGFRYRGSELQTAGDIIIGAELELSKEDPKVILSRIDDVLRMKGSTQPVGWPCAGCIFKNPKEGDSAGKLIEMANLKGESIGGAKVSDIHANFIINNSNATGADIMNLINRIQTIVFEKSNIELELEVRPVGFNKLL